MAMQEIEHKQILGGKSSALVTINSTLYVRCDTRAEFTRFQYSSSSLGLGQRLQGTSTWELQLFSCPLLAELTSKCLFSEAGVHTVTGQAKTDEGSSQEAHSVFLKNAFYCSFLILPICSCPIPKLCPTDQPRSYTAAKGVNIALHFLILKLHLARLHSPRKVWLCEHMTIFQTNS